MKFKRIKLFMIIFFLSFSGLEVVHCASFHLHNGAAHSDLQEPAERGSSSGDIKTERLRSRV